MSEPALELRRLTRSYKSGEETLTILDEVDFVLNRGEMVGLVGPSGSGKSSLLHAAGLLERPTSGTVLIDGIDGWALDDGGRTGVRRSRIGFVYQFHHLLPEFDSLDNVALPLIIAGERRRVAHDTAARLLTQLGLGQRLHHQPPQLSGGEQQRVAIARALANQPKLILADEPTGNLDPTTSAAVFAALATLAREEGVAALVATHNLELAGHMDRVVSVRGGKLSER
jgi:lipoprotein-releasing system ATP-binding protein